MKKILSIMLAVLLFCSIVPVGYADGISDNGTEKSQNEEAIQTRVEETDWFYRNNNGVIEKRLWSYTYGRWLTDWIPVEL